MRDSLRELKQIFSNMFNNAINDYFTVLTVTVVTLNGIAIPLSYNIVSDKLKPYLDKHIYNVFMNEERFRCNIIVSVCSFIWFVTPLLFNFELKDITLDSLYKNQNQCFDFCMIIKALYIIFSK